MAVAKCQRLIVGARAYTNKLCHWLSNEYKAVISRLLHGRATPNVGVETHVETTSRESTARHVQNYSDLVSSTYMIILAACSGMLHFIVVLTRLRNVSNLCRTVILFSTSLGLGYFPDHAAWIDLNR